ncbi:tRNA 2-thiocytidine(32) synthetase TtcA [Moritella sp.]|uniref:tRNA 2-thiocytidine(32) synthetase TtcA n=1 Tax=Moritella sp. TaxID=78556 RepID=UPI001DD2C462|nr:tRNA 2-thiocytidine(32) synthetase TtcA [Moritella sp.]MCJ8349942.1 tRNA 2-thiocytidine(32) synthetase TtcA [Moritella sp.]NQZ39765.1 tRNA 2-thiocytidine(32) synthetase TtcA [Moritella sp.]
MNPENLTVLEKKQFAKLNKKLRHETGKAIIDYNMIEDGDRVMVCLSGGADSYTMLDILIQLQAAAPISFDIIAVNLDQKQPGFPEDILPRYLENLGIEYKIVQKDTYSIVKDKIPEGKTTCSLCSRLRRGILYNAAVELRATKLALGHHADDIVETLFLNMFFGAKMKTMPPKLISDDKRNIVIRPLAYCREADIKAYSAFKAFPIIPCNLCGSQENLQRQAVKKMLAQWDETNPGRVNNCFNSIRNIVPSHLADLKAFDFVNMDLERADELTEFDTAFDNEIDVIPTAQSKSGVENFDPTEMVTIVEL